MTGPAPDGRWWAHCPTCGWFDTYATSRRARHKLDTHHNYAHAGFACPWKATA